LKCVLIDLTLTFAFSSCNDCNHDFLMRLVWRNDYIMFFSMFAMCNYCIRMGSVFCNVWWLWGYGVMIVNVLLYVCCSKIMFLPIYWYRIFPVNAHELRLNHLTDFDFVVKRDGYVASLIDHVFPWNCDWTCNKDQKFFLQTMTGIFP